MALMKCPECGKEISDKATSCPSCGYPISQVNQTVIENSTSSSNAMDYCVDNQVSMPNTAQEDGNVCVNSCEQSSQMPKRKKLKVSHKIFISIGAVVATLVILFLILILPPVIKCVNSYTAISPYLNYVGNPHPDEDEAITLTQDEYDNIDNVEFMGIKGKISFKLSEGYISSCTWTSLNFYSEEDYREFAEELNVYFEDDPSIEAKNYSKGNTYRYSWIDPYYGFSVTMGHGLSSYDPDGQIEIRWETSEKACEILGHTWLDATCTTPKTCHLCGDTEGKALGHTTGNWSEWDIDYDEAVNMRELTCTICEEIVETQTEEITSFVKDECFTIYANAFADRFEESSSQLNDTDFSTTVEYSYGSPIYNDKNYVYYRIQDKNYDYVDVGIISFTDSAGNTISMLNNYSENTFDCINILIEHNYDVSAVVYAAILAIDPGIGYSKAADVGQTIVDNVAIVTSDINVDDFQGINYNGINYLLYKNGKYHYLLISISN